MRGTGHHRLNGGCLGWAGCSRRVGPGARRIGRTHLGGGFLLLTFGSEEDECEGQKEPDHDEGPVETSAV